MYWCSLAGQRRVTAHKRRSPSRVHRPRRPHHRPPEALSCSACRSSSCSPACSADPWRARWRTRAASRRRTRAPLARSSASSRPPGRRRRPGVVALLRAPSGAESPEAAARIAAVQRTLAAEPGIASVVSVATTRDPRFVSRDGRDDLPRRHARRRRRRGRGGGRARRALRGRGRRHARRLGLRRDPDRRQRDGRPRPRRGARLPDPAAALARVLPRPRRAAAARGRDHDRARHVPRAHRWSTRSTGSRSSRSTW